MVRVGQWLDVDCARWVCLMLQHISRMLLPATASRDDAICHRDSHCDVGGYVFSSWKDGHAAIATAVIGSAFGPASCHGGTAQRLRLKSLEQKADRP